MITVTGNILDASDAPLHVLTTFMPIQFQVLVDGKVICVNQVQVKSNANDGGFEVELEPGTYTVTYATNPQISFQITVPASGGPYTIDQIVNTTVIIPTPPVYAPSGSGSPEGVIAAPPGYPYVDTTNNALYYKITGTGNTGWQIFVQL